MATFWINNEDGSACYMNSVYDPVARAKAKAMSSADILKHFWPQPRNTSQTFERKLMRHTRDILIDNRLHQGVAFEITPVVDQVRYLMTKRHSLAGNALADITFQEAKLRDAIAKLDAKIDEENSTSFRITFHKNDNFNSKYDPELSMTCAYMQCDLSIESWNIAIQKTNLLRGRWCVEGSTNCRKNGIDNLVSLIFYTEYEDDAVFLMMQLEGR